MFLQQMTQQQLAQLLKTLGLFYSPLNTKLE
jgi:hypothetical protein